MSGEIAPISDARSSGSVDGIAQALELIKRFPPRKDEPKVRMLLIYATPAGLTPADLTPEERELCGHAIGPVYPTHSLPSLTPSETAPRRSLYDVMQSVYTAIRSKLGGKASVTPKHPDDVYFKKFDEAVKGTHYEV